MSQIQFLDGQILFTQDEEIALDPDCCCNCDCDTLTQVANCHCISTPYDFSSAQPIGSITVTVLGSATPGIFSSCPAPASCASLAGSYVVACGGTLCVSAWTFICNIGPTAYWSLQSLAITHKGIITPTPDAGVTVTCDVKVLSKAVAASLPQPTDCTIPSGWSLAATNTQRHLSYSYPFIPYWKYALDNCIASCNEVVQAPECQSGSLSWDTDQNVGTLYCNMNSYSISLSA